jgi:prolyl oligopeptidase
MRLHSLIALAAVFMTSCTDNRPQDITLNYPDTRKDTTVVDNYFGTAIPDPYRWLEDDNSTETKAWVDAQNAVTFGYLHALPGRDSIHARLSELFDHERYSTPFQKAGRYFYFRNDGMQDQSVLYVQDGPDAEPRVLIDPNTLSKDGTVALGTISVSNDGKHIAYQVAASGSDWNDIRIMDIATGQHLEETLKWVKFSGMAWKGNGFYYSRYDAPAEGAEFSGKNEFHKVYFHTVGTAQAQDVLIHWNPKEPQRNCYVSVSDAEDALFLFESKGTSGHSLAFKTDGMRAFAPIVSTFDHDFQVADYVAGKILCRTNNGAPNYRLVQIDPKNPAPERWKDILPEQEHVLEGVQVAGGKLVATYLRHVSNHFSIHAMDGTHLRDIELPTMGEADFSGSRKDSIAFFGFRSFTYANTIFRYNMEDGTTTVFKQPNLDFNPDDFEVKQVFYPSKDGTRIPMFIVHRKGTALDGNNPCLLYGYGGFNISSTPRFSVANLYFMEKGGIFAMANLRGGGEYGEAWHKAGTKLQKQNVFDDFIAAAEFLVAERYTSPQKLAISGRSNGGLLVGACMTQRPDLFQVALPAVGVLDMLRFHKFTIGWAWTGDYGSSDNEEEFRALLAYSPLHKLKPVDYPATLITTADHDDRVVPAHSFKFAAALQAHHTGKDPVLIRIDKKAGHGAGKPLSMQIEESTDVLAFLFKQLGIRP